MTKSCFVAMPISTPDALVASYRGDAHHFAHVYRHLFEPAVARAGFAPVAPTLSAGELIHTELCHQLDSADMVLCDISSMNPNVLIELGVRIGRNKPMALVRDRHTSTVPFDAGVMYCLEYDPTPSWTPNAQVEELAQHLRRVERNSGGRNSFWSRLGPPARVADHAIPEHRTSPENGLGPRIPAVTHETVHSSEAGWGPHAELVRRISAITSDVGARVTVSAADDEVLALALHGRLLDARRMRRIHEAGDAVGLKIVLDD